MLFPYTLLKKQYVNCKPWSVLNNYFHSRQPLNLVQKLPHATKTNNMLKIVLYILVKHTEWPVHIITDSLLSPKTFGFGSSQNIYSSLENAESSLKQILYKTWIKNRKKKPKKENILKEWQSTGEKNYCEANSFKTKHPLITGNV